MSEEEKKALKYLRKNVIVRIDIDENGKEKIIGYGNAHKYIILNLIKKQQKEIKELKQENKEHLEALTEWVNGERINDIKHISKNKIREILEKLKDKEQEMSDEQGYWGGSELQAKIEILEELLEE